MGNQKFIVAITLLAMLCAGCSKNDDVENVQLDRPGSDSEMNVSPSIGGQCYCDVDIDGGTLNVHVGYKGIDYWLDNYCYYDAPNVSPARGIIMIFEVERNESGLLQVAEDGYCQTKALQMFTCGYYNKESDRYETFELTPDVLKNKEGYLECLVTNRMNGDCQMMKYNVDDSGQIHIEKTRSLSVNTSYSAFADDAYYAAMEVIRNEQPKYIWEKFTYIWGKTDGTRLEFHHGYEKNYKLDEYLYGDNDNVREEVPRWYPRYDNLGKGMLVIQECSLNEEGFYEYDGGFRKWVYMDNYDYDTYNRTTDMHDSIDITTDELKGTQGYIVGALVSTRRDYPLEYASDEIELCVYRYKVEGDIITYDSVSEQHYLSEEDANAAIDAMYRTTYR